MFLSRILKFRRRHRFKQIHMDSFLFGMAQCVDIGANIRITPTKRKRLAPSITAALQGDLAKIGKDFSYAIKRERGIIP